MDFIKMVELGIVFALLMIHNAIAAPESDLIEKLPGQREVVHFKQYSGYITTNEEHGRALYYYFVEAQNNATSRPLALCLNGGPGRSSLGIGALMENGPFKFNGKVWEQNKFSWNTEANMLYVESPIGVGFSYSNTTSDYHLFNDSLTAQDKLAFLLNWFKKFPEFRDADFYLIGESYMGNPYVDIEISINNGEFQWAHGLISDETYHLTQTICNTSRRWKEMLVDQNTSEACNNVFDKVFGENGDINNYDLTLGRCLRDDASKSQLSKLQEEVLSKFIIKNMKVKNEINLCVDDDILQYLNTYEVQKAIHSSISNDSYPWGFCSSGDQDSVVPFTATRTIANILAKKSKLCTINTYGTWYDNQ
ncbi:hypothetical protein SUGI_0881940 [Cryptomeria japonica]|nr:hypothetical protein SUGI_0881940 [Cryptomeria japonica]